MATYKLYLDDIRNPKSDGWVIARSFDEFVMIIEEMGAPAEISFDHDLGWDDENKCEAKNGYDCAKWLVEHNIMLENFNVHSANPVGRDNIISLLNNYKEFVNRKK